ncbi:MAG: hypothetical protein O2923_08145 [Verrucomicrobia bacterium]|nr:hypothetical protein [Verrucomicrobiota bacterium]MDA1088512.1 hypothetical protein [Verrucomicrobiota bacterium]
MNRNRAWWLLPASILALSHASAQLGLPGGATPDPDPPAKRPAPTTPINPAGQPIAPAASDEDPATAAEEAERREHLLRPGVRDPFWPIGYIPPPPAPTVTNVTPVYVEAPAEDWKRARAQLKVAAISKKGGKFLALLRDGSLVDEGDVVTVRGKVYIYKFKISVINQHGIETVPLATTPIDEN